MQKRFISSITGEVKFFVAFLMFFWGFMTLVSLDSNGLKSTINMSAVILLSVLVVAYALVRYTYLTIDEQKVKYVHTLVQRSEVDISQIKKIQRGTVAGVFKFLLLTYNVDGRVRHVKISPLTFTKEVLDQFISEIKRRNPSVDVDKSVDSIWK